ncbi:hypothetical protein ACN38_g3471 [Penicillium nordicum]|uniref:Uncharacterized protein n=1 Tax=Penicillium nordicum TaxID=229535 RepID=A0A0M8P897_9EURO|nr:hypothetical protein ACN38_g3471 [Penicillium nordicum]
MRDNDGEYSNIPRVESHTKLPQHFTTPLRIFGCNYARYHPGLSSGPQIQAETPHHSTSSTKKVTSIKIPTFTPPKRSFLLDRVAGEQVTSLVHGLGSTLHFRSTVVRILEQMSIRQQLSRPIHTDGENAVVALARDGYNRSKEWISPPNSSKCPGEDALTKPPGRPQLPSGGDQVYIARQ